MTTNGKTKGETTNGGNINGDKADDGLSHGSLESLQNSDARKILDVVDNLRKAGLGSILQLPQIVVCGDQSSGKSSVLEAITGIPFPRKENLCTRSATQIVMRRARVESVSVKIIPDKLRTEHEREQLEKVALVLKDFNKLDELMEQAMEAMGLKASGKGNPRAFSRDVLNIEISGPTRLPLTLVDLPGLIHSENKSQSKEDVEIIKAMVEDYIQEKRTIVLAVVSAKNDYANQIILKKARDLEAAERTLGVITKPDTLSAGSENEKSWIELAQNKDVIFGLGWHVLRNRSEKEMHCSLEERDANENIFFSSGAYRQLDRKNVGIEELRKRLSTLLYEHLKKELPSLQDELEANYETTRTTLDMLGQARETPKEQKRYLIRLTQSFYNLTKAAVDGNYEERFFDSIDTKQPIHDLANICRLRATVQYCNMQFAQQMRKFGAAYKISNVPQELATLDTETEFDIKLVATYQTANAGQKIWTHEEAIQWVHGVLERSRGRELPGNFNPLLVAQLFQQLSQRWNGLATAHLDRIAAYCELFVVKVLTTLASKDVYQNVLTLCKEKLESRARLARAELAKIMRDKANHPITYNHYYTDMIQKMRTRKNEAMMQKVIEAKRMSVVPIGSSTGIQAVNTTGLAASLVAANAEQDMDKFSASDALMCTMAYYKDELKYFVNCVTKQVIERCLLKDFATEILSPLDIDDMTDEQISALAAEPSHIIQTRDRLEKKLANLEEGQKVFKRALGGF